MKFILNKNLWKCISNKRKYFFLLIIIVLSLNGFGQGRCTNARTINDSSFNVMKTFSFPADTNYYWIKFIADTFDYRFTINEALTEPNAYVTNITLYGGTCGGLQIKESDAKEIFIYNLTQGATYFLRVEKAFYTYGDFDIFMSKQLHVNNTRAWNITDCPPPPCDLIHNGGFNPVDYNGPFKDAFQEQNVCGWSRAWASPDIFVDQPTNYLAFLGSYPNGTSYIDEGIWQIVNISANTNYNLFFDYKTLSVNPLTELRIYLADNNIDALFNNNFTPIPISTVDGLVNTNNAIRINNAQLLGMNNQGPLQPINAITVNSPNANFNRLVFFVVNNTTNANGIYLDNVRLTTSNLYLSAHVTNPCKVGDSGSIDLTVHNGVAPITYLWSNGATTQDLSNLNPGNYSVTVTDANNCPVVENYTIYQGQAPACPNLADQYGNYIVSNCGQINSQFTYQINNPEQNVQYTWTLTPSNSGYFNNTLGLTSVTANYVTINWTNVPALPASATINIHCENTLTGCTNDCSYEFNSACNVSANISLCNTDALTSLPLSTYSNVTILINGYLDLNKTITFNNCDIIMGPLAYMRILSASCSPHIVTFSNCRISGNECYHMWDGIYIIKEYSKLIFNGGTVMEDAINGVVSKYYGQYDLSSSTMSYNYRCFQAIGIPQSVTPLNGSIKSCTFFGTLSLLYPPMVNSKSFSGAEVKDIGVKNTTTGITIGSALLSTDMNYFTNLTNGVVAYRSNITLYNNNFTNNNGNSQTNCAIYAAGNTNANESYTIYVGGTQTSLYRKNYINNYFIGIKCLQNMNVNIAKNELTACNKSIVYNYCNDGNSVNISSNIISQGSLYGIFAFTNQKCASSITCNTISMLSSNFTKGIYISGSSINNTLETYNLAANNITACNGIDVLNTYRIDANNNTSTLYNNATGTATYGMRFQHCDYQYIYNCKVKGTTNPAPLTASKYGISIENTTHPDYKCNSIYYTAAAFNILGPNSNLGLVVSLRSNSFNNCDFGMFKQNLGYIGTQGNATTPWFNAWNTVTYHTYGDATSFNDVCYARSNPSNENFNEWQGAFTKQTVSCNPCTVPLCPSSIMCGMFLAPSGNEQSLQDDANDNLPDILSSDNPANMDLKNIIGHPAGYDETGWYMAKQKIYAQMMANKSIYMQDATFSSFINTCNTNSVGLLYKADYYVGRGNADSAEYFNNIVVATNDAETMHVFVNQYYVSFLRNDSLSKQDAETIRDVAVLCPFEYGDGVYIARALINLVEKKPSNYNNACENAFHRNKSMSNIVKDNVVDDNMQISLNPNPAKDQITVVYTNNENATDEVLFEVYNMIGKKQITSFIKPNQNTILNTSDLESGVYFYRFVYNGSIVKADKLVIIK